MAIQSKKKIILITVVMSILLAGLIVLLVVLATKKPEVEELPDSPVVATIDETVDGKFILEEEKADPTSASISTAETPTAETASALPKTGPTDLFAFALFAGALTTYLFSLRLKNSVAA